MKDSFPEINTRILLKKYGIISSMNKQMWSRQVILRYSLIQLPEVVLLLLVLGLIRLWINVPMWVVWSLTSLLLIINIILYPFVWRAYDKGDPNPMAGSQGIAADYLSPLGFVRINGELWRAKVMEGDSYIEKGEVVIIAGMHGLTLIVRSSKKETT